MRGFFARLFYGRYGNDRLNFVLLIAGMLFSIAASITSIYSGAAWYVLFALSTLILVIALLRMMSRNFDKRRRELAAYQNMTSKLKGFWRRIRLRAEESRQYRRFSCAQCGQKLRVPKGKGKIRITCTKCGHKFVKRT